MGCNYNHNIITVMKKDDFLKTLANELDLESNEINENSSLHLTSLMHLSLISILDEHFKLRVKAKDLVGIDSVDKLFKLIGEEKFD